MFVILAACRGVGWLVRRWCASRSVGEMIGASCLALVVGLLAPETPGVLFPPESKRCCTSCTQLGIGLYMFLVGLDFRTDDFRANAPSAVAGRSPASSCLSRRRGRHAVFMKVPGCSPPASRNSMRRCSWAPHRHHRFPVLARIIQERGAHGSLIATLSWSAPPLVTRLPGACWKSAWSLARDRASPSSRSRWRLPLGGHDLPRTPHVRVARTPCGARACLGPAPQHHRLAGPRSCVHGVGVVRRLLGLHAVFGGFLIGTAMPRGIFADRPQTLLEPFTLCSCCRAFFTYSDYTRAHDGSIRSHCC